MKKIIFILGLAVSLATISCNKDEEKQEIQQEIKTDNTKVSVVETESITIKIISGNGGYKATSSNEENASVSIKDNVLTIEGKKAGTAQISLIDSKGKKTTIDVLIQELITLEKNEVEAEVGTEQTIVITKGVGPFQYQSSDQQIVTAKIEGKTITITPLQQGKTATIVITDEATQKTAQISITIAFDEIIITEGKEKNINIGSEYRVTSTNSGIVNISQSDNELKVSGVSKGEATLILKDIRTQKTQEIKVKVVELLNLLQKRTEAIEGAFGDISLASGTPMVKYSTSDDPNIAVFDRVETDQWGDRYVYIRGISPGTTIVHVSDGDTVVDVRVEVTKAPDFSIFKQDITISEGNTYSGNYLTGSGNFEITIEDPSIVGVTSPNNYGYGTNFFIDIEGKKRGTTTIRVKEKRNNEVKEIRVVVE